MDKLEEKITQIVSKKIQEFLYRHKGQLVEFNGSLCMIHKDYPKPE